MLRNIAKSLKKMQFVLNLASIPSKVTGQRHFHFIHVLQIPLKIILIVSCKPSVLARSLKAQYKFIYHCLVEKLHCKHVAIPNESFTQVLVKIIRPQEAHAKSVLEKQYQVSSTLAAVKFC